MYIMSNKRLSRISRILRRSNLPLSIGALIVTGMLALTIPAHAAETPAQQQFARLYEDALARFERKDYAGAEIQLKNALQLNSRYLPGQLLMGKVLLQQGKSVSAEQALQTALKLGADRSEVVHLLAQAYLDQGKYPLILDRIEPTGLPVPVKVDVLVARAMAQLELGKHDAATRSLDDARKLDPRNVNVALAQTSIWLRQNRFAEARKEIEAIQPIAPRDARVWNMKGTVIHAFGDAKGTLDAYGRAIQFDPSYIEPRLARAALLLDLGRDKEAMADLGQLPRGSVADPRAEYLKAMVYSKQGNTASMRMALKEAAQRIDSLPTEALARRPQYQLIGGLAHYALNQRENAQKYLQMFLSGNPNHAGVRKLLATVMITDRNFAKALDVLAPLQRATPNDAYVLSLLATASMGLDRHQAAARYAEQAVAASQNAPEMRASLGFTVLGSGDMESGINHLRQAFQSDPQQSQAGMALAILELKRGQPKAALEVANTLIRRQPRNPVLQNLMGAIKVAAGDRAGGRAAYDAAAKLDPAYDAPRLNLARIDTGDGRYDQARVWLNDILRRNDKQIQALFEYARVEHAAGRPDEAMRLLEKARAIAPHDMEVASALMDRYIERKNWEKLIPFAKELETQSSGHYLGMAALGRGYLALSDPKKAVATFERMVPVAGKDPVRLYEIARYQLAADNVAGAQKQLNQALSLASNFTLAEALLIDIDLRQGNVASAEQRLAAMRARAPNDAVVMRAQGDIAMARQKYVDAISAYGASQHQQKNADTLVRLARAHFQAGQQSQSLALLAGWLKANPRDPLVTHALAETQMRKGDYKAARQTYEQFLKTSPNDVGALNNLASILIQLRDPASVNHAERAYRLAPEDAAVNDTLGWALLNIGKPDQALLYLREARLRDSQNGEIRYHLALALHQLGKREEARRELEAALAGPGFAGMDAARALASQINRR